MNTIVGTNPDDFTLMSFRLIGESCLSKTISLYVRDDKLKHDKNRQVVSMLLTASDPGSCGALSTSCSRSEKLAIKWCPLRFWIQLIQHNTIRAPHEPGFLNVRLRVWTPQRMRDAHCLSEPFLLVRFLCGSPKKMNTAVGPRPDDFVLVISTKGRNLSLFSGE